MRPIAVLTVWVLSLALARAVDDVASRHKHHREHHETQTRAKISLAGYTRIVQAMLDEPNCVTVGQTWRLNGVAACNAYPNYRRFWHAGCACAQNAICPASLGGNRGNCLTQLGDYLNGLHGAAQFTYASSRQLLPDCMWLCGAGL